MPDDDEPPSWHRTTAELGLDEPAMDHDAHEAAEFRRGTCASDTHSNPEFSTRICYPLNTLGRSRLVCKQP